MYADAFHLLLTLGGWQFDITGRQIINANDDGRHMALPNIKLSDAEKEILDEVLG